MTIRALLAAALVAGLALVPLSPAATTPTPDQQLAAGLERSSSAARAAWRGLARPSDKRVKQSRADLNQSLIALTAARKAAPQAVGALETPSVQIAVNRGLSLSRQAAKDIARKNYGAARLRIAAALKLTAVARGDFGVPLEKEFASFVVYRDFRDVPAFANFSGLTATVGSAVDKVVIGAPDRLTANVGEPHGTVVESDGLPITDMSAYIVSNPIGEFRSGWCKLAGGLINCDISPAMGAEDRFTIAFGPKLAPGTKLLVKFRSTSGRRSYDVFATR